MTAASAARPLESFTTDGEWFEDLLHNAECYHRTRREEEFVADMRKRWDRAGLRMYLTEAQYEWLKSIGER